MYYFSTNIFCLYVFHPQSILRPTINLYGIPKIFICFLVLGQDHICNTGA